jgi:putative inorganic carbon (hco3(-)) transporter
MNAWPPEALGSAPLRPPPFPAPDLIGRRALRSTLGLLAWPLGMMLLIRVAGLFGERVPLVVLYGFAVVFGAVLLWRGLHQADCLLAVFVLYIPLSKLYVIDMLPGLNGTNGLMLALLLAWGLDARRRGLPLLCRGPCTRVVALWMALSLLSFATAAVAIGPGAMVDQYLPAFKAWLDQFVVFYAMVNLLRDGAMARRVVIYMMLGSCVVLALGFEEWLDKRELNSIEKSRLLGPQLQPNDLGAFLVYGASPFIGLFLAAPWRWRSAGLLLWFGVLARILLATFSRGAYIGLAAAAALAGLARGKVFLALSLALGLAVINLFPEAVPESFQARVAQSHGSGNQLDGSSQTRLVLWQAAVDMTGESPLLGKGFGMFQRLKAFYTEREVEEADNHNMFLYIASQMGLPALLAFLWIFWRLLRMSLSLSDRAHDTLLQGIGLGGAALVGGVLAVNMFGSRMVDIGVMAYFWIYLAAVCRLWTEQASAAPVARTVSGSAPTRRLESVR